jgi:hypothetical protein
VRVLLGDWKHSTGAGVGLVLSLAGAVEVFRSMMQSALHRSSSKGSISTPVSGSHLGNGVRYDLFPLALGRPCRGAMGLARSE